MFVEYSGFGGYAGPPEQNEWLPAAFGGPRSRLKYALLLQSKAGAVRPATAHARLGALLLMHYEGYLYKHDEWVPQDSPRINWAAAGGRPVSAGAVVFGVADGPAAGAAADAETAVSKQQAMWAAGVETPGEQRAAVARARAAAARGREGANTALAFCTVVIGADGAVANPWVGEVELPFKYDKPSGYFAVQSPEREILMSWTHRTAEDAIPATEAAGVAAAAAAKATSVPPELAQYTPAPATAAGVPANVLALSKNGVWREARVVERRSTPAEVRQLL